MDARSRTGFKKSVKRRGGAGDTCGLRHVALFFAEISVSRRALQQMGPEGDVQASGRADGAVSSAPLGGTKEGEEEALVAPLSEQCRTLTWQKNNKGKHLRYRKVKLCDS